MAERRMFAKSIIDSDAFLDMPLSAQALYFHLSMRADDEGFVGNPKRIRSMVGASEDDLKLLIAKRFLLVFESGVVVIKHWKIHNYIQSDRAKPTTYIEERSTLALDGKKAYTEIPVDTKCIQNGYKADTQVSIGKDSIDKNSKEKSVREKKDTHFNSEDYDRFIEKYNIAIDGYSSKLHEMDFKALDTAYQASEYLRTNILSLSFICKEYDRILGGYYKDWKKPSNAKTENDREYSKEELNALIKDADKVGF